MEYLGLILFSTLAIANIAFVVYHLRKDKQESEKDYVKREESNIEAHHQAFDDDVLFGCSFISVELNKYGYPVHKRVEPRTANLEDVQNDIYKGVH